MNLLFVNYGDFTASSLNHIGVFANRLVEQGHACIVAVPSGEETLASLPEARFGGARYETLLAKPAAFPDGRPADLIHAWTPRECIRNFVTEYQALLPIPARLVVHLEDNEEHLIASFSKHSLAELRELPGPQLAAVLHPLLPHPVHCRSFLHLADAITHLSEPLREFAPRSLSCQLLPPGLDARYLAPATPDAALRERLQLRPNERVLVYTGSNTFANEPDIRELYEAVALLNRRGRPTRLLRSGITQPAFHESLSEETRRHVTELGFLPKAALPGLLQLADVLVQPGRPGPFDDYRLPSKLPEFLASGRPVVLPHSNIGLLLRDGEEALLTRSGNAAEIADACERLFDDPALAARIGAAGARFARGYFDPERRSAELLALYEALLRQPSNPIWTESRLRGASPLGLVQARLARLQDLNRIHNSDTQADAEALALELRLHTRLLEEQHTDALFRLDSAHADNERLAREQWSLTHRLEEQQHEIARLSAEKSHLAAEVSQLLAAERKAQQELTQAWSEHAQVARRVAELDAELRAAHASLSQLKRSLSWKLSAPVRGLARLLGRG